MSSAQSTRKLDVDSCLFGGSTWQFQHMAIREPLHSAINTAINAIVPPSRLRFQSEP